MSRLAVVDPATAGDAKPILDAVQSQLGIIPNLFKVAANSPAALSGLVQLSGALGNGSLDARLREQIALTVAQQNGSDYCLSAHSAIGAQAGLLNDDISRARAGDATDSKTDALLTLAREIVRERGDVGADAVARAKAAGATDGEIVEVVANVALNVYTNYLNVLADTEIDFPVVRSADLSAA